MVLRSSEQLRAAPSSSEQLRAAPSGSVVGGGQWGQGSYSSGALIHGPGVPTPTPVSLRMICSTDFHPVKT